MALSTLSKRNGHHYSRSQASRDTTEPPWPDLASDVLALANHCDGESERQPSSCSLLHTSIPRTAPGIRAAPASGTASSPIGADRSAHHIPPSCTVISVERHRRLSPAAAVSIIRRLRKEPLQKLDVGFATVHQHRQTARGHPAPDQGGPAAAVPDHRPTRRRHQGARLHRPGSRLTTARANAPRVIVVAVGAEAVADRPASLERRTCTVAEHHLAVHGLVSHRRRRTAPRSELPVDGAVRSPDRRSSRR